MKNRYILILFISLAFTFTTVYSSNPIKELDVPKVDNKVWEKSTKGLNVAWSNPQFNNEKYFYPTHIDKSSIQKFKAWKGERLTAKLILWSPDVNSEISFVVNQPKDIDWLDETTTGFMTYVMSDELSKDKKGGCGYRPDKTEFDSILVADRISQLRRMQYDAKTVRPIWITFEIPRTAQAGEYKGDVTVMGENGIVNKMPYIIQVVDRTLPEENSYHLDLWQNPFAVARVENVPLWSNEHFSAMRPIMERLGRAGQKTITATITHKPWNSQTYDYYENMITEIRTINGDWKYDYSLFDSWVEFMTSCGVGPYIYCYSVIPWELTFKYYDQVTNSMVSRKMDINSPEFEDYWVSKLTAFAKHLKSKGWFEKTIIAMDERPKESMDAALRVIRTADKNFKISLAGNYHAELDDEIFDISIPCDSIYPSDVIKQRKAIDKITTFYTCCSEAYPNTFSFSQPIESQVYGLIAQQRDLDGYLRWAYNSWVESPNIDSRFVTWAAGDTYIVYPSNNSSARFELMIDGIQLFNKIEALKQDPKYTKTLQKLLIPFRNGTFDNNSLEKDIRKINSYLNSDK